MVECLESLVHAFYTKISNWFEQGLKLLFRCKCKSLETTIYYVLLVDNWFKLKVHLKTNILHTRFKVVAQKMSILLVDNWFIRSDFKAIF